MIATLIPHPEFAPVPHVEIRLEESEVWDGGGPGDAADEFADGGSPAGTGPLADGGPVAMLPVTVPAETERITLWRVNDAAEHKVQGVVERSLGASLRVQDHGAPPNATSRFELECFVGAESITRLPLGETFLSWSGGDDEVILQQPLNPQLFAVVRNMAGSWPEIVTESPGELVYVEDEALPSLIEFGPRTGALEVQVDFEAATRDVARQVQATLGIRGTRQLQVWLIRSPNPGLLPPVFYGRVGQLREVDVTVGVSAGIDGGGISRFQAELTQVKQPAPALIAPSLRYSDLVAALGGTYSGIAAALPRYSDWASAWEFSGAAG